MNPTASSLDRAMVCAPSVTLPQSQTIRDVSTRGNAIHAYLADPEHALASVPEEHRPYCAAIDLDALPVGRTGRPR